MRFGLAFFLKRFSHLIPLYLYSGIVLYARAYYFVFFGRWFASNPDHVHYSVILTFQQTTILRFGWKFCKRLQNGASS